MKADERIYLYDGSYKGLLTVFFYSLKYKVIPKDIQDINVCQRTLFDKYLVITPSDEKFLYTSNKLKSFMAKMYKVYLSNEVGKEITLLKYIINPKDLSIVLKINEILKRVSNEAHKLKGFIRFRELDNKVLYAEIEPENNCLEILSYHFMKRLKNENWIINDVGRKIMSVYNKNEFLITSSEGLNSKSFSSSELELKTKDLWKTFIENVNIDERKNLKCQMNFMPKKYWKYMCEMEGDLK